MRLLILSMAMVGVFFSGVMANAAGMGGASAPTEYCVADTTLPEATANGGGIAVGYQNGQILVDLSGDVVQTGNFYSCETTGDVIILVPTTSGSASADSPEDSADYSIGGSFPECGTCNDIVCSLCVDPNDHNVSQASEPTDLTGSNGSSNEGGCNDTPNSAGLCADLGPKKRQGSF